MITSHVWRPPHTGGSTPAAVRHLCQFMNCRQPADAHARTVTPYDARRGVAP